VQIKEPEFVKPIMEEAAKDTRMYNYRAKGISVDREF